MGRQLLRLRRVVLGFHVFHVGGETDLAVDDKPAVLRVTNLRIRPVGPSAALKEEVDVLFKPRLTQLFRQDVLSNAPLHPRVRLERCGRTGERLGDLADRIHILRDRLTQMDTCAFSLHRSVLQTPHLLPQRFQHCLKVRLVEFGEIRALRLQRLSRQNRELLPERLDRLGEVAREHRILLSE